MARSWNGLSLAQKVHRAAGRAIIGVGIAVAVDGKRITHVVSGTLRRSIHVANPYAGHDDDEGIAAKADMLTSSFNIVPEMTPMGPLIEVGSWVPYACVEWVGRGHPGITQALEAARGVRTESIVRAAFREEGLL